MMAGGIVLTATGGAAIIGGVTAYAVESMCDPGCPETPSVGSVSLIANGLVALVVGVPLAYRGKQRVFPKRTLGAPATRGTTLAWTF